MVERYRVWHEETFGYDHVQGLSPRSYHLYPVVIYHNQDVLWKDPSNARLGNVAVTVTLSRYYAVSILSYRIFTLSLQIQKDPILDATCPPALHARGSEFNEFDSEIK